MEIFVGMMDAILWSRITTYFEIGDLLIFSSEQVLFYWNKGIKISSRNYSSLPPKIGITAEQPNMSAA